MKIENELFDIDPELVPDGTVPVGGIIVVEVLDADGVSQRGYQILGNMEVDSAIGLLEIGKLMVWDDLREDAEDELDDA